jgi:lantibiotic modifying enzyme
MFSLFRGAALLPQATHAELLLRGLHTLRATAQLDAGLANWPPASDDAKLLVQWCHGAPGMLTSFARAPASVELDELLLRAGELVWQAGPLRKGSNLCHGTAGNGAALLALFTRTGDQLWLDRARCFAMHAAAQVAAARAQYGQGRYSLWTGDAGVAVYLWQCLTATSGMPTLDF